jgi:hypothetical protein
MIYRETGNRFIPGYIAARALRLAMAEALLLSALLNTGAISKTDVLICHLSPR